LAEESYGEAESVGGRSRIQRIHDAHPGGSGNVRLDQTQASFQLD